jgi:phage host-nuclease inhibitor protein Gam
MADVEIQDRAELEAAFKRMVDARHALDKLETVRDKAKAAADDRFATDAQTHSDVLATLEHPALDYCTDHQDEIVKPGTKSGIVGPAKVEFRTGKPVLRTRGGDEIDEKSLLEAIDSLIENSGSQAEREMLEKCVDRKPRVVKDAVKKLPATLLLSIGAKVDSPETVSWKPNV